MIIVGGPYTHKDKKIKKARINRIANACVKLMTDGKTTLAVSPLIYGLSLIEHTKSGNNKMPDSYDFWESFCLAFIEVGTEFYVLNMDGWDESNGLKSEINKAKERNIPVYLVDPTTLDHIKVL